MYRRIVCFKIHTVGEKRIEQNIIYGVKLPLLQAVCAGQGGVDPPPRKMNTFFLGSLALSVPIYRNFQSNDAKWRSLKLWKEIFI